MGCVLINIILPVTALSMSCFDLKAIRDRLRVRSKIRCSSVPISETLLVDPPKVPSTSSLELK